MADNSTEQSTTTRGDDASSTILPRHIAIIMDGNGRWAQKQGKPRIFGHQHGAQVVDPILTHCAELGIEALTLYSFSMENWKRPAAEIEFLMQLAADYLAAQREKMIRNNIRFRHVGRRTGLPDSVLAELDETTNATGHCTGTVLALALNYGSRTELTDAVRNIADAATRGEIAPHDITEQTITDHLYTTDMPDPDLLIRTAGEMRLSNYLLWQSSYAEFYVTRKLWPDFTTDDLDAALADFARRHRRYGAL